jgi:hypothetical protein
MAAAQSVPNQLSGDAERTERFVRRSSSRRTPPLKWTRAG